MLRPSIRARCVALILAKRAATAHDEHLEEPNGEAHNVQELWSLLQPELWDKVAKLIPVSLAGERWARCDFFEWAIAPQSEFPMMHSDLVHRLKGGSEACRADHGRRRP